MWFSTLFNNQWIQDIAAMLLSFMIALLWLRIMDHLAHRGLIDQKLSRKIIHTGTGPIFLLCWFFFSPSPAARFFAALIPLAISVQFFLVGMSWMSDPAAVQAMSRTGDPREILRGPLFYGIMFVLLTILFWRSSPVGIVALMILSGGDGFADIIGRKFGTSRLPFNKNKSWIGTAGMFFMSFLFGSVFVLLFNGSGLFETTYSVSTILVSVALISLAASAVEALTANDLDNLTITLTSVVLGLLLF